MYTSLLSKRFHGVWEQRKIEEQDFQCFAHAKNGARAKKRKRRVGGGEVRKETLANKPAVFENRPFDLSQLSALIKMISVKF